MTFTRWVRDVGAGLAGIAAAVGIGALAIPSIRYPQGSVSDRTDQVAAVVPATSAQPLQVSATLAWSAQQSLLLPSRSGTVTEVNVSAGRPVRCGDTLMAIDGAPLIGWCSPFPLWRPLDELSVGPDAQAAAATLQQLGYGTSSSTLDAQAIVAFQQDVGLEATGILDPSTLLWIGVHDEATLDSIAVSVGQAVAGQTEFGRVGSHLQSATVNISGAEGERVFRPLGSTTDFVIGDGGSVADLAGLETVARSTNAVADPLQTVMPGNMLLSQPIAGFSVPASSLIVDNGSLCVIVAEGPNSGKTIGVTVIESLIQGVIVGADLTDSDLVVVSPKPGQRCSNSAT